MLEEGELKDFISELFGSLPKEKNSKQLEFCLDNMEGETTDRVILAQLADIMCKGIKILFNPPGRINLNEITEEQLKILNCYFNSFGWQILLEKANSKRYRISMKNINNDQILSECIYINI